MFWHGHKTRRRKNGQNSLAQACAICKKGQFSYTVLINLRVFLMEDYWWSRNTITLSKWYCIPISGTEEICWGAAYLPQLSSEWASGTSSLTRKKTRLPVLKSWSRYATLLQISSVLEAMHPRLSLVASEPLQWLLLESDKKPQKPSSSGQFIEERTR